MLPEKYQWIVDHFEPEGDARQLFDIARRLESEGNLEAAATVYDRAYGLDPRQEDICEHRRRVLDALSVTEHGMHFRYIPYGSFLMGNHFGEPDEVPWHSVWLSPFWMSETPVSWVDYCRLMNWELAPRGWPRNEPGSGEELDEAGNHRAVTIKLRWRYCADKVYPAEQTRYDTQPMVGVSWQEMVSLSERLSTSKVRYGLPTEAQWEKAARGGLIGNRYAWGDEPPDPQRCDFIRFHEFSILPMKAFPPNGFGLYAVNGCVWEWTSDWYDRDYYHSTPQYDPTGPPNGEERVLKEGSWVDCAEAVTVPFRMSSVTVHRGPRRFDLPSATIGFRLCRTEINGR
jgi:formylglycine-generating enzyme required for sulfatase activity